jgi:AraC-like DNA-binding protein
MNIINGNEDMLNGKSAPFVLKKIREAAYRSMGGSGSREGIGAGFMDKSGVTADNVNFRFPRYVLVVVLRGRGTYVDDHGEIYPLESGSCFQRFPQKIHSNYVDPDSEWNEFYLEVGPLLYQALSSMLIIRSGSPVSSLSLDENLKWQVWDLVQALKTANEDMLPELVSQAVSLLGECHRRMHAPPEFKDRLLVFEEACRVLSNDFDLPCDLNKFCRKHGVGYEYFRKMFKERCGISPWQYRVRRRLDLACGMLSGSPDIPVTEISGKLGYSSPYEFSAQFKRYVGTSPLHFRKGKRG